MIFTFLGLGARIFRGIHPELRSRTVMPNSNGLSAPTTSVDLWHMEPKRRVEGSWINWEGNLLAERQLDSFLAYVWISGLFSSEQICSDTEFIISLYFSLSHPPATTSVAVPLHLLLQWRSDSLSDHRVRNAGTSHRRLWFWHRLNFFNRILMLGYSGIYYSACFFCHSTVLERSRSIWQP